LVLAGVTLYGFIEKQNRVTELRLAIPVLAKKVRKLKEENSRLRYEIEQFESPIHLMELARKAEFSHLKYPYVKDVIVIEDD
jgi:cell division protein FtsL